MIKAASNFIKDLCTPRASKQARETPLPDSKNKVILGLIVGHTKRAKGAALHGGGNEYDYNSAVALNAKRYAERKYGSDLTIQVIFRDGIGIGGAYKRAAQLGCDAVIELHFNAFNTVVAGTETLVAPGDANRIFGQYMQEMMCRIFNRSGQSRGLKVIARKTNGGFNVYSFPQGPNCLVEPFFGDNPNEAMNARKLKLDYAYAIVDASADYFKSQGLL